MQSISIFASKKIRQIYVISPSKIYHWSQSVKPHPIKNSKLMFPDQISRLHAHISSCFHTHAFILSCFMSSCSRFHASCSCLHTHTLSSCPHAFMFMPSCSHGGLPCDG